jgi:SpoVK/Ycf46/Vps4 family AAA+-type ATPase
VRKGRFDEIFFVDLPTSEARTEILTIHLAKRGLRPRDGDLQPLAAATDGFSGAEIEQGIVAALYAAHAVREVPKIAHFLGEFAKTKLYRFSWQSA